MDKKRSDDHWRPHEGVGVAASRRHAQQETTSVRALPLRGSSARADPLPVARARLAPALAAGLGGLQLLTPPPLPLVGAAEVAEAAARAVRAPPGMGESAGLAAAVGMASRADARKLQRPRRRGEGRRRQGRLGRAHGPARDRWRRRRAGAIPAADGLRQLQHELLRLPACGRRLSPHEQLRMPPAHAAEHAGRLGPSGGGQRHRRVLGGIQRDIVQQQPAHELRRARQRGLLQAGRRRDVHLEEGVPHTHPAGLARGHLQRKRHRSAAKLRHLRPEAARAEERRPSRTNNRHR
mmetsp:Transcript_23322/g.66382  ORF Transcript_23322/g.66382 Transcript_23322/m.66382 type:complete len:294 (+) Transcript_23322:285-1166(+)